jgi:hypothetical protein
MVHVDGWLELMHVLASWGFGDQGFIDEGVDQKTLVKCRGLFTPVEVQALTERG